VHPAGRRRPVLAAIAAAAIAAVTVACGSSASSKGAGTGFAAAKPASAPASAARSAAAASAAPTGTTTPQVTTTPPAPTAAAGTPAPGGSPLAGESAGQIVSEAAANTEASSSVRMQGAGTQAGKGITFDLSLARGQGCEGTLSMSKTETFQLVYLHSTVWMKPSNAFYASLGSDKAALSALEGKYIKVSATNSLIGNISQLCALNGLLGGISSQSGKGYAAASATFGGQPAIKITQPGHPGYAYVSDTAKPVILQVSQPGSSGGTITFADYNVPVTITAPPAAQTIDGSQFGL